MVIHTLTQLFITCTQWTADTAVSAVCLSQTMLYEYGHKN